MTLITDLESAPTGSRELSDRVLDTFDFQPSAECIHEIEQMERQQMINRAALMGIPAYALLD